MNEASTAWRVTWRMESECCYQTQYQPFLREANFCRRSVPFLPAPASPLSEPVQPRDRLPSHRSSSEPHPSPPEPEKAIPPSPPEAIESPGFTECPPLTRQPSGGPSQPSPAALATTAHLPLSAEQAPPKAPTCSETCHRRACRRPLSSTRRGQTRRARRAADAAVQGRAATFASAQAAVMRSVSAGSGKRIYTPQQLLSLRPQGRPPAPAGLSAAALCFVPRSARYSCYARAVRLGLADSGPPRPFASEFVPTVAAREMRVRVHVAAMSSAFQFLPVL